MIEKDKEVKRTPPNEPIESIQYDLFSQFVSNEPDDYSNSVEFWEQIPKYHLNSKQMEKMRTSDGFAKPYKWDYLLTDKHGSKQLYTMQIQPALLEQTDGKFKAFFPSTTEELVEEALKKIFLEQNKGVHDPRKTESWVRFSYSMIKSELKKRGRTRDYYQIKQAIKIMTSCIISVYRNGKEIYQGAILSDYMSVDREEYIEDRNRHHIARLPVFISHGINSLEYRQFNYKKHMEFDDPLTRWIHKKMINRFVQANYINSYHFTYSDLKGSGYLQQTRETDNRKKVTASLKELRKAGIIFEHKTEDRREGRKIIDVKYTIQATPDFVREQKAANKRNTENRQVTFPKRLN